MSKMENSKIKLPEGFHDLGEEIKNPVEVEAIKEELNSRVHYPSLWFHDKEGLKSLPKEGTAVIHYKKIMEREEKVTEGGKTTSRYTTELQIHGIQPGEATESEAEEANEPDDEDAIEKGLEAASKETSKD
jgi:hypothetical protein